MNGVSDTESITDGEAELAYMKAKTAERKKWAEEKTKLAHFRSPRLPAPAAKGMSRRVSRGQGEKAFESLSLAEMTERPAFNPLLTARSLPSGPIRVSPRPLTAGAGSPYTAGRSSIAPAADSDSSASPVSNYDNFRSGLGRSPVRPAGHNRSPRLGQEQGQGGDAGRASASSPPASFGGASYVGSPNEYSISLSGRSMFGMRGVGGSSPVLKKSGSARSLGSRSVTMSGIPRPGPVSSRVEVEEEEEEEEEETRTDDDDDGRNEDGEEEEDDEEQGEEDGEGEREASRVDLTDAADEDKLADGQINDKGSQKGQNTARDASSAARQDSDIVPVRKGSNSSRSSKQGAALLRAASSPALLANRKGATTGLSSGLRLYDLPVHESPAVGESAEAEAESSTSEAEHDVMPVTQLALDREKRRLKEYEQRIKRREQLVQARENIASQIDAQRLVLLRLRAQVEGKEKGLAAREQAVKETEENMKAVVDAAVTAEKAALVAVLRDAEALKAGLQNGLKEREEKVRRMEEQAEAGMKAVAHREQLLREEVEEQRAKLLADVEQQKASLVEREAHIASMLGHARELMAQVRLEKGGSVNLGSLVSFSTTPIPTAANAATAAIASAANMAAARRGSSYVTPTPAAASAPGPSSSLASSSFLGFDDFASQSQLQSSQLAMSIQAPQSGDDAGTRDYIDAQLQQALSAVAMTPVPSAAEDAQQAQAGAAALPSATAAPSPQRAAGRAPPPLPPRSAPVLPPAHSSGSSIASPSFGGAEPSGAAVAAAGTGSYGYESPLLSQPSSYLLQQPLQPFSARSAASFAPPVQYTATGNQYAGAGGFSGGIGHAPQAINNGNTIPAGITGQGPLPDRVYRYLGNNNATNSVAAAPSLAPGMGVAAGLSPGRPFLGSVAPSQVPAFGGNAYTSASAQSARYVQLQSGQIVAL